MLASEIFTEFSGAIASNQTIDGEARNSPSRCGRFSYRSFHVAALSTQGGTLRVEWSRDKASWFLVETVALSANSPVNKSYPVVAQHYRVGFMNGATLGILNAQSAFHSSG